MPQGRIDLHLRDLAQGNTAEIDIPRGGVWLLQPGIYDIEAGSETQPARVAVFEGSARFAGGALDMSIKAGDVAVIGGTATLTASVERVAPDDFSKWCRGRDYSADKLAAAKYVSPATTGYEVLDQYGTWKAVPQYGEVWYPNSVGSEWVPYRDGRWAWVAPWGWNWVDSEPWGFAPFHYGRWAYIDNAWGWVPGAPMPQPVYAPALVAFIDNPGAILASAFAGPAIGWFPLGPGEAYWPSYTRDRRYIAAINAGAVADSARLAHMTGGAAFAAQAFVNRRGATVVPQDAFASAGRIGPAALRVSDAAALHARATARGPAIRAAAVNAAGFRDPGGAAVGGHAAAIAGPSIGREGFAGRGAPGIPTMRGAPHTARMAAPSFAGPHMAQMAAPRFAGPRMARMAAPRFASPHMAHMAAPRFASAHMGHMAAPHFAAPHMGGGGPHFAAPHMGGGGPHFGSGRPPGGGPHIGAGGGGGGHGGGGGGHGGGGPGGGGHGKH